MLKFMSSPIPLFHPLNKLSISTIINSITKYDPLLLIIIFNPPLSIK